MKRTLAMILAAVSALSLAACGNSGTAATQAPAAQTATQAPATQAPATQTTTAEVKQEEPASQPSGGFQEFPIWEDEEVGFLNVSGVYFQPVPMSNGNENFEDYSVHFEADVAALKNNLGYGTGDWVPYMKVDFELTGKNTGDVISGSFMPMNADDGPHYGANIKLPNADTYSVKLTFHSPEDSGYLVHLDDETGPGGKLTDYEWPLVLNLPDVWDYVPQEW